MLVYESDIHVLVVDDDPDAAPWDDERSWRIEHPHCKLERGSLAFDEFDYEEYTCGVAYEEMNNGKYMFGGPQYWPDGHFKQLFKQVVWRDYWGEMDIEIEPVG